MSRDAACRLSALPPHEQKKILKAYETLKDPGKVFREHPQAERVRSLAEVFSSWSDFSAKTYELFVREIVANLREASQGYA